MSAFGILTYLQRNCTLFTCLNYLSVCRIRRNMQYGKSSALQTEFTMFLCTTISCVYINDWNWNTWACNRKNMQCMIKDGWIDGWKGCMMHGWMELSCRHMFSWNVTFFPLCRSAEQCGTCQPPSTPKLCSHLRCHWLCLHAFWEQNQAWGAFQRVGL